MTKGNARARCSKIVGCCF